MKSLFISIVAVLILGIPDAAAQKGFSFGIVGGPQISGLSNDNYSATVDRRTTYNGNIGVTSKYNFRNKLGFALDFRYSWQGQRYYYQIIGSNANGFVIYENLYAYQKLSYIKIPLLFTYNSNTDKRMAFACEAGPQLSLLMGATYTNTTSGYRFENTSSYSNQTYGFVIAFKGRFRFGDALFLTAGPRLDIDFIEASNSSFTIYNGINNTASLDFGLNYLLVKKEK